MHYLAEQDTDEVLELFVVPSDGSASAVRLNGALVAGGNVASFAFTPHQSRVLYLADERADTIVELFSAPSAGGPSAALVLLPAFGDVTAFAIAPDSQSVVYRADPAAGVVELYHPSEPDTAKTRPAGAPSRSTTVMR